jgi:hypothetical protein
MTHQLGVFGRLKLTLVSLSPALAAVALLVFGACSSSLDPGGTGGNGGGAAGTGGTGAGGAGCAPPEPSTTPFNCLPTYAEQVAAVCAAPTYVREKQAGSCASLTVTYYATGYEQTVCGYDATGALVAAHWCTDTTVQCGEGGLGNCITSANAPDWIGACGASLPSACDADAGRD